MDYTLKGLGTVIDGFNNQNRVTPISKQILNLEMQSIAKEYPLLIVVADKYRIVGDKQDYINAYDSLLAYITPILNNLNESSVIDIDELNTIFSDFNKAKMNLHRELHVQAYDLIEELQLGSGSTGGSTGGGSALYLEDLLDVAKNIPDGKFLAKVNGVWTGVESDGSTITYGSAAYLNASIQPTANTVALRDMSGQMFLPVDKPLGISIGSDKYIRNNNSKLYSGFSDDSGKWQGRYFADYLNQSVRINDDVKFKSVITNELSSLSYVSGYTGAGFKIFTDGSAEFDNLTVRKQLNVTTLNIREIVGSGGSIAVTNVAKLSDVIEFDTYYECHIDTDGGTVFVQFRVNDIVRCQVWDGKGIKYYSARVTEVGADYFKLDKASKIGAGVPSRRDSLFQFGNTTDVSRQGLLYLTNSDTGAPYMDVLDGITSDNLAGKTKVRAGRLDGITDPVWGVLQGYGFYGKDNLYINNGFFSGSVNVTGGNAETVTNSQTKANEAQRLSQLYADTKDTNLSTILRGYTDSQVSVNNGILLQQASATAQTKADAARDQANTLTQQLISSIQIGGQNTFSKTTVMEAYSGLQSLQHVNGLSPWDGLPLTNGIFAVGSSGNTNAQVRVINAITGNGDWTVSGYVKSNGIGNFQIDICDGPVGSIVYNTSPNYQYFEYTSTVTNYSAEIYNFFDIAGIGWQYFQIQNLKVENGSKATPWSPSAKDVQDSIDNATTLAQQAKDAYTALTQQLKGMAYVDVVQLANLGNTVITGGKITTTLLDVAYIQANVVTAQYINALQIDASAIKTGTIDAARINASQIISNGGGATNTALADAINNVSFGGVNLLKNSGEFVDTSYWYNAAMTGTYPDGTNCIATNTASASPLQYTESVQLQPNTIYTWSAMLYSELGVSGTYDPIQPMHFWLGSAPDQSTYQPTIIAYDQNIVQSTWKKYYVTFRTPNTGAIVYMRPYVYFGNVNARIYATHLQVSAESKPTDWKKSLFQLTIEANRIASGSSANALIAAANDAQTRANTAQSNAIGAAANDAQARANTAQSNAIGVAANDAQGRADTAQNNATGYASSLNTALTNALRSLAYQDIAQVAYNGQTLVSGGYINTVLLNAAAIQANVVTAGYVQGLSMNFTSGTIGGIQINGGSIDAANFQLTAGGLLRAYNADIAGNLNAYSGAIGGIGISGSSIYAVNGSFSLTSAGVLTATQANISGTINASSGTIGSFYISGGSLINYAVATNTGGNRIAIYPDSANFIASNDSGVFAGIGPWVQGTAGGANYVASFTNGSGGNAYNYALLLNVTGGSVGNYAIDIISGGIRVNGLLGFTGYMSVVGANNQFDKYRSGIYMGRGTGSW